MSSAEQIGQSPNSHPAAAGRRPLPDLYDMVQGRENPAVICRCQKTGIGEKSGDHRTIYNSLWRRFNRKKYNNCRWVQEYYQSIYNSNKCLEWSKKTATLVFIGFNIVWFVVKWSVDVLVKKIHKKMTMYLFALNWSHWANEQGNAAVKIKIT